MSIRKVENPLSPNVAVSQSKNKPKLILSLPSPLLPLLGIKIWDLRKSIRRSCHALHSIGGRRGPHLWSSNSISNDCLAPLSISISDQWGEDIRTLAIMCRWGAPRNFITEWGQSGERHFYVGFDWKGPCESGNGNSYLLFEPKSNRDPKAPKHGSGKQLIHSSDFGDAEGKAQFPLTRGAESLPTIGCSEFTQ